MSYLLIFVISVLSISSAKAEAPYAAAGWRPQRPFNLPNDYLAPARDIERQQQQSAYIVEINKQRVDFAGQLENSRPSAANTRPDNAYLPPHKQNPDFFKQQRPPYQKPAPKFVFQTVGSRPQNPQKTKIFQVLNTQQPREFGVLQQSEISQPAATYGPPRDGRKFIINYPDSSSAEPQQTDDELDEGARIAIEALNEAQDAYNRQQAGNLANNNDDDQEGVAEADVQEVDADGDKRTNGGYPASRATYGQYYILGPDKRFQLVRFTTSQSEEEAQKNGGFTAKLRYIPVGEINDPVFKYDSRGQLVRIFKK
ncbi:uncharacterized protein [Eurosta solidaginis]|uniref:uncharacterized protein n=1 Tax=Eurosta solidaginis TaxID=178769 RepID=UPI003530DE46